MFAGTAVVKSGEEPSPEWLCYRAFAGKGGLVAQEFFDGLELGFGHVQILFGVLGVLLLHGRLGFGDVGPHALLGGDDVTAKAVA